MSLGAPNLDAAVVTNYELGYDHAIKDIDGKLRGSVYYKRTEDVIAGGANVFVVAGPTVVAQSDNIGHTSTRGLELALNGKLRKDWAWDVGYAYQTTDDGLTVNTAVTTVPLNYEDTFPHHVFNAHLGWAKGPWEADAYGQVATDFQALGASGTPGVYSLTDIDGYQTLASRVAYKLDNDLTVALSGANISQARQATGPGLEEERQVFLSVSKKF